MPVGFQVGQERGLSSKQSTQLLTGGFHDPGIQDCLLPDFFVADGRVVDPYDGGEYRGEALKELCANLRNALQFIARQESAWPYGDDLELKRYYERGRRYGLDLLPPREQALADVSRALHLAEVAQQQGEALYFVGD